MLFVLREFCIAKFGRRRNGLLKDVAETSEKRTVTSGYRRHAAGGPVRSRERNQ